MISIKRSISFVPEQKKVAKENRVGKNQTARLRCTVTWNSQRVRLSINHSVNPATTHWDASSQRCKARSYHGISRTPAVTINRAIDEQEQLVNHIFLLFEERDVIPTKAEFMEEYNRIVNPQDYEEANKDVADRPLFAIYDEFVSDGTTSGRWSSGTLVKTRTIRKHLYNISPTLSLNDVINGGVNLLIKHFSTVLDNLKEKGLANTTIKNDIAFVKVFMRWAQEHGYCDANAFLNQRVKLKTAEKPVIFLDWDELMKVYNFDFGTKNYLAHVRDVFCFCCFTSLRYSDVYNLRRSNITDTEIIITTIKTHDTLRIELNRYSRAILEKYADFDFPGNRALPVITNQKMNDYLKELGKICELDTPITITLYKGTERIDRTYKKYELLSTHCGRRTFISNAIMLGVPPNIVMKWTGHSDYKTMEPYLAIADKARATAMTVFDRIAENENAPLSEGGAKSGAKK
ncbi:MAG: integrase catalytic domain-containing protein [Muribaculaceae bacterium]|nr:integrase catalytic domain-containing protein [Muribaculaceae bacterium]